MIINPRVTRIEATLVEEFRHIDPATIGHLWHYGFMDPAIRPLYRRVRVVGPAVTLKIPALDSTLCHKVLDIAEPGDVIVVDRCGDTRHACWGEMVTLGAKMRGVAGAIIDGAVTDVLEIEEMRFPVYARTVSALTTKLLGIDGEINTPVQCGGVTVMPGDLIVADDNGIVVIPPEQAATLLPVAKAKQEQEGPVREKLRQGIPLAQISGAEELVRQMENRS
ncbi:MAG: RraA family protein [Nitrospinota bacterium]|nr:MAG: RraA family protein [Nitrospinota bacterium]